MNNIIFEAEYADIILTLLQPPYSITSLTKLVFISFCSKYETNTQFYINRSKDFVDIFMRNITLKLSSHYEDLETILHFIQMLEHTSVVTIEKNEIWMNQPVAHQVENKFLKFCANKVPNPILEIKKLDEKALIEEVIRYV